MLLYKISFFLVLSLDFVVCLKHRMTVMETFYARLALF